MEISETEFPFLPGIEIVFISSEEFQVERPAISSLEVADPDESIDSRDQLTRHGYVRWTLLLHNRAAINTNRPFSPIR